MGRSADRVERLTRGMSTLTVVLFVISVIAFFVLLVTAIYFMLADSQHSGDDSEIYQMPSALLLDTNSFNCEVEVVTLDEHLQITNMDEPQLRMDGTGLGRGLRLVPEDQLQLTLQPGINQYRLYSMDVDEEEEEDKHFLAIRVAPDFVELKPVLKFVKRRMEIIIWKLKPYTIKCEVQLAERQVFCGYLQKTVHFSRAPGKYFRFLVTTSGPQNRLASFVSQSNVQLQLRKHRLLTMRVQPGRVSAANQSNLPMQVTVRHRSETLKRRLSQEMRDLPLNGTYSFTLARMGQGIQKPRKALRLHLSEKQILVEPHSKFGTLPLSCDVYLPDTAGDSPNQIVSGEFLSPLQLPRSANHYVLSFYMHMKGLECSSVKTGPVNAWSPRQRKPTSFFK